MVEEEKNEKLEERRLKKNARQREYSKETGYAAQAKYAKENTRRYVLQVMCNTEFDIIEKLDQEQNKSGYIKRLIREDIKKSK